MTVTLDEICAAIRDVFEDTRTIPEPAGALGVAGLKRAVQSGTAPPGPLVAIVSGANMNFARLGYVAERAAVGEHREAILAVTIPELPGAFLAFCAALGQRNVTEFNYRLSSRTEAHIFVGVEVAHADETRTIVGDLARRGYACVDLSDDDLAKTHIRHMVGGRTSEVRDEVLFDFEFPERPGALLQFLSSLGSRWNVSLFHYRNHGAAFGRVLCGLEVPPAQLGTLRARLDGLGFSYTEATDNAAGRFFLR
jgi:threonine dehydratase